MKSKDINAIHAVVPRKAYFVVESSCGKGFALLDTHITRILRGVQVLGPIRVQAIMQGDPAECSSSGYLSPAAHRVGIEVSINLYSTVECTETIGIYLSKEGNFLQHPDIVDSGVNYVNPQYFRSPGGPDTLDHLVGIGAPKSVSLQSVCTEVERIMDSLDTVDEDPSITGCSRILTPLLRHRSGKKELI